MAGTDAGRRDVAEEDSGERERREDGRRPAPGDPPFEPGGPEDARHRERRAPSGRDEVRGFGEVVEAWTQEARSEGRVIPEADPPGKETACS